MLVLLFGPRAGIAPAKLLRLHREFPEVREALAVLGSLLGLDLGKGSPALRACLGDGFTGHLIEQAVSIGLYRSFAAYKRAADLMAVHCLGTYAALVAADCMGAAQAHELLAGHLEVMCKRGGALTTIDGVALEEVHAVCARLPELELATINAADLCSVSGSLEALGEIEVWATRRGGRVQRRTGFGAWHSAKAPAVRQELHEIARAHIRAAARVPLAFPLAIPRCAVTPDELADALAEQVVTCVHWQAYADALLADAGVRCIEIGAAPVLVALARRGDRRASASAIAGFQGSMELAALADSLGEGGGLESAPQGGW